MVLLLRNSFRLRLNEVKQSDFELGKARTKGLKIARTRKNIFPGVKRRFVASEGGFGCFGLFWAVFGCSEVVSGVFGCYWVYWHGRTAMWECEGRIGFAAAKRYETYFS